MDHSLLRRPWPIHHDCGGAKAIGAKVLKQEKSAVRRRGMPRGTRTAATAIDSPRLLPVACRGCPSTHQGWSQRGPETPRAVLLGQQRWQPDCVVPDRRLFILILLEDGTCHRPFFLSRISQFSAFWGSSRFGRSKRFFFVFPATNVSEPCFICMYRAASFYSCTYYLIKYARVLSHLVRNSSNKDTNQNVCSPWHGFPLVM